MVASGLFIIAGSIRAEDSAPRPTSRPFFAFQNGLNGRIPLKEQPKLLKELGYDGMEFNSHLGELPDLLSALDASGLKLFTVYLHVNIAPGQPPYDPGLKNAVLQLKGRGAVLALMIEDGTPSATDADERAVKIIREIGEIAEAAGLRVALYPHVGVYVARVENAIRLAKKVDRKNVGVCFNLCHFLKLDRQENLEKRIAEALPYLFVVNINGSDEGDTQQMDWDRLIQTLDRGSFDIVRVLKQLDRVKYQGPIGLQCYNVPGDPRDNLKRSIEAWRKLCRNATIAPDAGFTPLFNGHDLSGWEGESGYWTVEEGAITGTTTAENPLNHASYLFWRGGKPSDFELRAEYRFVSPDGNSGINFRSQELPRWDVKGYQADMETGPNYSGILYECNQREIMTQRGQKVVIAEDGKRQVTALTPAVDWATVIKPHEWNEYVVIARGPEIILKINGVVTSHVIDQERGKAASAGVITLQVHPGPPTKVQFRNIRIKKGE
jgi:sugar phosphate isomerase/epimerase